MSKSRRLGAVCAIAISLLLFSNAANPALVKYIVEGDLTAVFYGDPYNLDGAHYIQEIIVDTSAQYTNFVVDSEGNDSTTYNVASNAWISSIVTLTNRPNGAAAATVDANQPGTPDSRDFYLQNILEDYPHQSAYDAIAVGTSRLTGEFEGPTASGLFYFFPKSFFPGSGPHALPDIINKDDMIVAQSSNSWVSKANPGPQSQYVVTNGLIYTAAVPIPAAAWLFGSGLLGLVGMARRKNV